MANAHPETDAGANLPSPKQVVAAGGDAAGAEARARSLEFGLPLVQSRQQLLNNEYLSDVVFKVGQSGVLIHAHKIIITVASEVFFAQLNGHFAEAQQDQQNVPVRVEDIEPDIFMEVLRYIYYEHVNITGNNMLDIYYASEKYLLNNLKQTCEEFIDRETNEDNVLTVFQRNRKYNFDMVDERCLEIICDNPLKLFKQDAFLALDEQSLLIITAQPVINCHPDQISAAVETWKRENGPFEFALDSKDVSCRKMHFFSTAQFSANIDTSFQLTVKSKIALYGVGVLVGAEPELLDDGELESATVEILLLINQDQLISKTVPVLKNLYTYEIMFEKVIIDTNCSIQVTVKKSDNLKDVKMLHFAGYGLVGTLGKSAITCCNTANSTGISTLCNCRNRNMTCYINCVAYLMCHECIE